MHPAGLTLKKGEKNMFKISKTIPFPDQIIPLMNWMEIWHDLFEIKSRDL